MINPSLWSLYMIRCADNALYIGITLDVQRRFSEHAEQGRKCAKYLRGKYPFELVYSAVIGDKSTAYRLERKLKKLSKSDKEAIILRKERNILHYL